MLHRSRSRRVPYLRRIRRQHRLSLRELSARCGINHIKLHYFEHGLRLRADELRRVAEALDCSPADLEGRNDD
jgi:transcriptional regulator with XRE-family HTH domain